LRFEAVVGVCRGGKRNLPLLGKEERVYEKFGKRPGTDIE
jgi:hypothetical protein